MLQHTKMFYAVVLYRTDGTYEPPHYVHTVIEH
jgi:hypothetical protein